MKFNPENRRSFRGAAMIYGLYCPTTGALRYIGKANCIKRRLKSHIRDARRSNRPVCAWIRGLAEAGLEPRIAVILYSADWVADEVAEIHKARQAGESLLNVAAGGDEPFCPKDVLARNGEKVARLTHDNPTKKIIWTLKHEMGVLLRNGHVREETKAKLRLAAVKRPDLFGHWATI